MSEVMPSTTADPLSRILVNWEVLKLFKVDSCIQIGKTLMYKVYGNFIKGKNGNGKNKKLCFMV